jgi:glycosyltransferase involved in cell wall biosynthesis
LGAHCIPILVEKVHGLILFTKLFELIMPRVLRIINRLNLGGPTYNVAYLSKYLAPEFETLLVAGIKEDTEESSEFIVERMGLKPVYIPEMHREINLLNDRSAYLKIKKLIAEFKPDIVHTHAAKAGVLGRLAASDMNVPIIIHTFHGHVFHSYFNPAKTFLFKNIEKYLSTKSTRIIAISNLQKQELCDVYKVCSNEQTVVIPLGFDLERFRQNNEINRKLFRAKYGLLDDTVVVLIIGRIVQVKNHPFFIEAFEKAKARYNGKMVGLIVGDGDDRNSIEKLATIAGLTISTPEHPNSYADLIFTSWIKDIEHPLAGCDIVVMTSLNEGTPVSLIEAQAAGKPIVSTEVGGIGNVVHADETALLSKSGDLETFITNLVKLLNDSELRQRMGSKGWPFVASAFNYTRLVTDMRILYNKLLNQES